MAGQNLVKHNIKSFAPFLYSVIMLFALACDSDFEFSFDHDSTESIEEVLTVGERPTLIVNSENGSIEVTVGAENVMEIEAEIRRPDDFEFAIVQDADTVTITAQAKGSFFGFHSSPGAEIEITAPPDTQVDLRTSNGSIQVEGIQEPGSIRTSNGDIVLEDVKGHFEARTSNGSIEFEGELVPGGNNELRTSNGSISVELLGEIPSVRFDATTSNGRVTNTLPITESSVGENHISGTIGNGEAKLVVRTSNGSVTIQ